MKHALILASFPAGSPRGSWPAEEFAARVRAQGQGAEVVMDLAADAFLVVDPAPPELVDVSASGTAPVQEQYTAAS
ncbi:hypothetical protein [Streptomyces sp. NPDC047123]|uniref:hypothetical protein n=1 Tax=unclassified Streptomyces TaxID=2593676 RepID=UPI0033CA685F